MDLSIIIVNWNTRELLRNCLASVFSNSGSTSVEVLVVDNASTDGSAEMVTNEFSEAVLIRNQENRGFAAANNQAIRRATGRYLLLLNSDTIVLGDVLSGSVQYMDSHPDVGAFGCRVLNTDRSMQPTCFQFPNILNVILKTTGLHRLRYPRCCGREHMRDWKRDTECDVDTVTGCYMMVRREAVEQVGLLDEHFFFFGEETDWCCRFRAAGWRVRFAPVGEIIHHGGASARKLNYRRDLMLTGAVVRLHRKHGGVLSAVIVWAILWLFNASRFSFWLFATAFTGRPGWERALHFLRIALRSRETWPKEVVS